MTREYEAILTDDFEMAFEQALRVAQDVLRPGSREAERAGRWTSKMVKAYWDLELVNLLVPKSMGGYGDPLAASITLEALASGDCGGLLYNDSPGPYSGVLAVFLAVEPQDFSGISNSPFSRARFGLSVFRGTYQDLLAQHSSGSISGVLDWCPGTLPEWSNPENSNSQEAFKNTSSNLVLNSSTLFLVGDDFIIGIDNTHVTAESAKASALQASGGVRLTWRDLSNYTLISNQRAAALYAKSIARLWIASVLVGLGQCALDYAIAYGKDREVFGIPIVEHQANSFELAVTSTKLEAARLGLRRGCTEFDMAVPWGNSTEPLWMITQAYCEATEASLLATDLALQLLGGHGYMEDHLVEKWWREARCLVQLYGGQSSAISDLADMVLKYHDPFVV